MKRALITLTAAICLSLSACCESGEPCDLIVVNDSGTVIYSVALDWENQTMGVRDAGGRALLARGETFGITLEGESGRFTVIMADENDRPLGRATASYRGRPIWLTLEEDGTVSVREEALDGDGAA